MPAKNTIKTYVKDGLYHIFNRGVDNRHIFMDDKDYEEFLKYLKAALLPPPDPKSLAQKITINGTTFKGVPRQPKNFYQKIELLAYCLMPDQFHLIVKQVDADSLKHFMKAIATRYAMYFNKRHNRKGVLFQNIYQASMILEDINLVHLSRYLHLKPTTHSDNIVDCYSSYGDYVGLRKSDWLNSGHILAFFQRGSTLPFYHQNYEDFIHDHALNSKEVLGNNILGDSR